MERQHYQLHVASKNKNASRIIVVEDELMCWLNDMELTIKPEKYYDMFARHGYGKQLPVSALSGLDDDDLKKIGVSLESDRQIMLKEFDKYINEGDGTHIIEMVQINDENANKNAVCAEIKKVSKPENKIIKFLKKKDAKIPNSKQEEKQIQFVYPQESDYIRMTKRHISNCPVTKRIIHFLQFYEEQQSVDEPVSIYDHMQSLNGYDISQFLEDWYQVKINHLNEEKNINWLKEAVNVSGSEYMAKRNEFNRNDDIKNHILLDQLDSIRAFLFHSRHKSKTFGSVEDNDNEYDEKYEDEYFFDAMHRTTRRAANNEQIPKEMSDCSTEEIVHILNNHIFDDLTDKAKEKLKDYQKQIIDHIIDGQINGNKLIKMGRRGFMNDFAERLNMKKLKPPLGKLYNAIKKYFQHRDEEKANRFVTEAIANQNDNLREEYYSFGQQYRYTKNAKNRETFVEAKYDNLREEVLEYYARRNVNNDAAKLLEQQMEIIDSMEEKLQSLLRECINGQSITNSDVLWNKNIGTSRKQFKEIISKLCKYVKVSDYDWNGHNSSGVGLEFKLYEIESIKKAIKTNKENYIKQQQENRIKVFIEKCNIQMRMESMKKLKASRYQSINKAHRINVGDPISFDHVLALTLYTQCTTLCTQFRLTYRKLSDLETFQNQKKRHSLFANMGRLIYESFIFYASKNGKVRLLYHGLSEELFFKILHCKFNAPTSTTTEENIACNFGRQGIVMKLESAHSNEYIKTLNMALFTCFDNECEHLIMETHLHIKDIFVPRIGCYIGNGIMNRLSLYDRIVHYSVVENEKLLNEKTQKGLIEILQHIADGTMSKYTKDKYANGLIQSLITKNDRIKFNMNNSKLLRVDLTQLFISVNGLYEILHRDTDIVVCKLKENFQDFETLSPKTDSLYVEESKDNINDDDAIMEKTQSASPRALENLLFEQLEFVHKLSNKQILEDESGILMEQQQTKILNMIKVLQLSQIKYQSENEKTDDMDMEMDMNDHETISGQHDTIKMHRSGHDKKNGVGIKNMLRLKSKQSDVSNACSQQSLFVI